MLDTMIGNSHLDARTLLSLNPLNCCGQVTQSIRYVYSCPELAILIKMNTHNASGKALVILIFCQTKPWLPFQFGLAEDSRTTNF